MALQTLAEAPGSRVVWMLVNPGLELPWQACFVHLGESDLEQFTGFLDGSSILEAVVKDLPEIFDRLLCNGMETPSSESHNFSTIFSS